MDRRCGGEGGVSFCGPSKWLGGLQDENAEPNRARSERLRRGRNAVVPHPAARLPCLPNLPLIAKVEARAQLLFRSIQGGLVDSVPRRSAEQVLAESRIRAQQWNATRPFGYYAGGARPGGECARLLEMDSSLNILELMGRPPAADDKRDSDAVLQSRMQEFGPPLLNVQTRRAR